MVWGASKVKTQPFHVSPSQSQACFEPLPFCEQSSTFSLKNHPHTFPINRGRCPLHFPSLKTPQTSAELTTLSFKNIISFLSFKEFQSQTTTQKPSLTSIQDFQTPNSPSPSLTWVELCHRKTSLSCFWSGSSLHPHHPNKLPFTSKWSSDHFP